LSYFVFGEIFIRGDDPVGHENLLSRVLMPDCRRDFQSRGLPTRKEKEGQKTGTRELRI